MACTATVHPGGFVRLDAAALARAPEETGLRALAAVIAMIGGAEYPPRFERLAALYRAIAEGLRGGRTLGGCRILPRKDGLLICREPAALAGDVSAPPGMTTVWNGRFRLRLPATAPAGVRLGGRGIVPVSPSEAQIPAAARPSLPVLRLARGRPAGGLTQDRETCEQAVKRVRFFRRTRHPEFVAVDVFPVQMRARRPEAAGGAQRRGGERGNGRRFEGLSRK